MAMGRRGILEHLAESTVVSGGRRARRASGTMGGRRRVVTPPKAQVRRRGGSTGRRIRATSGSTGTPAPDGARSSGVAQFWQNRTRAQKIGIGAGGAMGVGMMSSGRSGRPQGHSSGGYM